MPLSYGLVPHLSKKLSKLPQRWLTNKNVHQLCADTGCRLTLVCQWVGDYRKTLLMYSFSLLQQWMVYKMGGKWPYSCYFVRCCSQDLFKTAHSIFRKRLTERGWGRSGWILDKTAFHFTLIYLEKAWNHLFSPPHHLWVNSGGWLTGLSSIVDRQTGQGEGNIKLKTKWGLGANNFTLKIFLTTEIAAPSCM